MARDYYDRDRNMWDRGRDEVRSWFGDEDAERRRRLDGYNPDEGDWRDERVYPTGRHQSDHPASRSQRARVADAEYSRDWDLDFRPRSDYDPYRLERNPEPHAGDWHERDPRSMYGGSHAGRRAGRQYDGGFDSSRRRQRSATEGSGRYSAESHGSHYSDYYNDEQGHENFAGRGPSGYRRSDERIREDLNETLTWDRNVDASNIEVGVSEGIVTLSGTVATRRMKRRAEDLADTIRGVEDIHNQLRVNRTGNSDSAAE